MQHDVHRRRQTSLVHGVPISAGSHQLRGLAVRGIEATYETVRRRALKFGAGIDRRLRTVGLARDDKWHLDEVVVTINDHKHWLWRAVAQLTGSTRG